MLESPSAVFSYKSVFTYGSSAEYLMKKYKSADHFKSVYGYSYHSLPSSEKDLKDFGEGENLPSKLSRIAITYICYILVIALFPISFWICFKKVHSLERLVVLRLGKLQPVIGPGYCIILPLIDNWSRVDLRPKTYSVPAQQVLTADGAIIELSSTIEYCVSHAVHYVTKLRSQEQSVQELVQHYLTNLISEQEQTDLEKNREVISSTIKIELNKTVECWGLEILSVVLLPMKVLKEAESVDPLTKVLDVLKTVVSDSNNSLPLVVPDITHKAGRY